VEVASTIRSAEKRDEIVSRAASPSRRALVAPKAGARDHGCQSTRIKFLH